MANRHQDIETRMAAQNKAEDIFEKEFKYKYMEQGGIIYKYGIHSFYPNEEQKSNMKHIPAFIRNTPDFFILYNDVFQLVEVKSCSAELWLKQVDFEEYRKWIKNNNFKEDKHFDSWKKCWIIPFEEIVNAK